MLQNLCAKVSPGLRRWLFPIAFGLWTLRGSLLLIPLPGAAGLAQSGLDRILELVIPALLLVQLALFTSWTRRQLVFTGLATLVLGVSMLLSRSTGLFLAWIFLLAAKDAEPDDVIRLAFWSQLVCFVFTVSASLLGLLEEERFFRENLLRYALGYSHPNVLGMMVLQLMCCLVYLRRNRIGLPLVALCLGAAVFAWAVPNSRASAIALGLLAVLCVYRMAQPHLPDNLGKAAGWCLTLGAIGIALFTVILSLTYRPQGLWLIFNRLFSGRLELSHQIFEVYGLPVLGTPLAPPQADIVVNGQPFRMPVLDSSYIQLLLRFGVPVYFLWTGLFFGAMRSLRRKNQVILLGILAIYAVHATMECSMLQLRRNVFLLVIGMAICRGDPLPEEKISKTS